MANIVREAWAACVFSYKFLMPVETLENEKNTKDLEKRLLVVFSFLASMFVAQHCSVSQ